MSLGIFIIKTSSKSDCLQQDCNNMNYRKVVFFKLNFKKSESLYLEMVARPYPFTESDDKHHCPVSLSAAHVASKGRIKHYPSLSMY